MTTARGTVIVVGGEPATGRSLEALLQAAGHETWFQPEPFTGGLGGLLADSRLLLVAPGLSAESRNVLAEMVTHPVTEIAVLELLPVNGGEAVSIQGADDVPWPCPLEELRRRVRAALLAQEG